jgi:ATP-dependent protease HslVU (ClpYQ) peptidase subunit
VKDTVVTLCMAAICSDSKAGPLAVVAADRMVTLGNFIEFEHTVPKMAPSTPFSVAMIAGDTLLGTSLARNVAGEFVGAAPNTGDVAARLALRYVEMRRGELEHQILSLRGLDLQSYYGGQQSLNGNITAMLDNQMAQFNLGIELLVAGVDAGGAHIYSIENPGQPERQHDVIGYAAIGSGGIHALQAMIGFRHSPTTPLKETVFQVYAAKRRAEVAPGVGIDTDMAIISSNGTAILDEATLKKLKEMYHHYGETTESALNTELEHLDLDEQAPEQEVTSGTNQ